MFGVLKMAQATDATIGIKKIEPRVIGTNMRSKIHVAAQLLGPGKVLDESMKLFHVDELGNAIGEPLCTMFDTGDSRVGDAVAGDGVYSCFAWLNPKWKTSIGLLVQARRKTPNGVEVTMYSRIFLIGAVDGVAKTQRDNESEQERIMRKAQAYWAENRAKYGLSDAAVAATARSVRELEGVRDVKLTSGNDIVIYFKVGGRDQLSTFDPK